MGLHKHRIEGYPSAYGAPMKPVASKTAPAPAVSVEKKEEEASATKMEPENTSETPVTKDDAAVV